MVSFVRNNLVYNGQDPTYGGIGVQAAVENYITNYDINFFNNTVSGNGIGTADTNGAHVRNKYCVWPHDIAVRYWRFDSKTQIAIITRIQVMAS